MRYRNGENMIRLCSKDHRYSIAEREDFLRNSAPLRATAHVFLQTCNRVEIYSGDGRAPCEVARHLFRVVSGLESRFIGERHIQGQVRRAYNDAIANKTISTGLHRLFQTALRIGKRIRKEAGISHGAVSYSSAVMHLLKTERTSVADNRILIVGVNRTTETIIRYLVKVGCESITIVNRSIAKAIDLASVYGITAMGLGELDDVLCSQDIVITATSSEQPMIVPSMIPHGRQLLIIDLAIPRDVDPIIGTFPLVRLFNVSDVESRIDQNLFIRRHAIEKAEQIIEKEVSVFSISSKVEYQSC